MNKEFSFGGTLASAGITGGGGGTLVASGSLEEEAVRTPSSIWVCGSVVEEVAAAVSWTVVASVPTALSCDGRSSVVGILATPSGSSGSVLTRDSWGATGSGSISTSGRFLQNRIEEDIVNRDKQMFEVVFEGLPLCLLLSEVSGQLQYWFLSSWLGGLLQASLRKRGHPSLNDMGIGEPPSPRPAERKCVLPPKKESDDCPLKKAYVP